MYPQFGSVIIINLWSSGDDIWNRNGITDAFVWICCSWSAGLYWMITGGKFGLLHLGSSNPRYDPILSLNGTETLTTLGWKFSNANL